jgi:hypothetical protein
LEDEMSLRAMLCFGLLTTSVTVLGCGSSGIQEGIPADAVGGDTSKVPDPMAGMKLHSTAKGKAVFNDPMKPQ